MVGVFEGRNFKDMRRLGLEREKARWKTLKNRKKAGYFRSW